MLKRIWTGLGGWRQFYLSFTFVWPLVLTVGMFCRKWSWSWTEAWGGWDFLQKRSWPPAWACSPPNLGTDGENSIATGSKVGADRCVCFEGVCTCEPLHSERPLHLRGVSLYSLRGRKLLSYFFMGAVAAKSQTGKENISYRTFVTLVTLNITGRSRTAPNWSRNIDF